MSASNLITQAAIAVRAAFIMSDPDKWCQGYWAINAVGQQCPTLGAQAEAEKLGLPSGELSDYIHWVQSNSPDARQFCIEGAIMHAAPTHQLGRTVIDQLDRITGRDHQTSENYYGEAYPKTAQSVNDENGDAHRALLVQALLELADTLLNGDPDELPDVDVEKPVPNEPEAPQPPTNPIPPPDGYSL